MSNTGIQSPLGVNVVASTLLNEGLTINPVTKQYLGISKTNDDYLPGSIVNDTCLKWLTYAINDAYNRGQPSGGSTVDNTTYNNLLAIGQSRIPALANGLPPTYLINDPSEVWEGQATSGYAISGNIGQGQDATWFPYNTDNPNRSVTQWGFLRCLALQAWNVFNWQGSSPENNEPEYKNYTTQFLNLDGFIEQSNSAIFTLRNSINFLDGTYSNMNDLISGDITGVSLSTQAFGQDLINLGKVLQLSDISKFGLPSILLKTIQQNNGLTQALILALITSGLTQNEINDISNGTITPNISQEQKIYGAFTIIVGQDLSTILSTLNCKTKGITRLTDLLNVKKLFPISYTSLTVPVYNTSPGPTNSKTYYLLFVDQELNPQLLAPNIREVVGVLQPTMEPAVPEPEPLPSIIDQQIIEQQALLPFIQPKSNQQQVPIPPYTTPPVIGTGGCVVLESYVPCVDKEKKHNGRNINQAWMLEPGMEISLGTEDLSVCNGKVIKTLNDYQPCVKIITAHGVTLQCSTTAPLLTSEDGFMLSTEVLGKKVAVMSDGQPWYDEVIAIENIGMKFVRVIDTGSNSFWAGERQGAYILHHNASIEDRLYYDKK